MNKKSFLVFIILIALLSFMLISCDNNNPATDPIVTLTNALNTFSENTVINIDSQVSVDGKTLDLVTGCVDRNMNQAKITVNADTYYYFSKIRFKGNDQGITIVDYMSFPSLIDLMGATLLNFKFDNGNFSQIKEIDGVIIAQFIGKGATYSFNTAKELDGGSISFFISYGKITKTVFSSSYQESGKSHNYTAVTTYSTGDKLWETIPKVKPSATTKYASYIIKKLAEANPSKTFRLESTNHNTSCKVSDLITDEKIMSSVLVQSNNGLHTLTVKYTKDQLLIGISGAVKSIDLCYDDDYKIYYMFVNSGNKYILS